MSIYEKLSVLYYILISIQAWLNNHFRYESRIIKYLMQILVSVGYKKYIKLSLEGIFRYEK